jgi:hypothetical protein
LLFETAPEKTPAYTAKQRRCEGLSALSSRLHASTMSATADV